jgi:hypothetical protein
MKVAFTPNSMLFTSGDGVTTIDESNFEAL